jgi:hypothetical protein
MDLLQGHPSAGVVTDQEDCTETSLTDCLHDFVKLHLCGIGTPRQRLRLYLV